MYITERANSNAARKKRLFSCTIRHGLRITRIVIIIVFVLPGIGIIIVFVLPRKLGWRLGLQSVTGALSLAFFLGLIYRSASLYHPQRRAILHLKNQRSKLKEKKSGNKVPKQPLVDLSPLGSRPVRMLMLAAGAAGFGLYTPAFYIVSALDLSAIERRGSFSSPSTPGEYRSSP